MYYQIDFYPNIVLNFKITCWNLRGNLICVYVQGVC